MVDPLDDLRTEDIRDEGPSHGPQIDTDVLEKSPVLDAEQRIDEVGRAFRQGHDLPIFEAGIVEGGYGLGLEPDRRDDLPGVTGKDLLHPVPVEHQLHPSGPAGTVGILEPVQVYRQGPSGETELTRLGDGVHLAVPQPGQPVHEP